jgi:two-component system nitrogen regulation response regulator GlnG
VTTLPQPAESPARAKPALLIVDDDPLITDSLAFALGADFEVLACDSRQHAIELLRQLPRAPELALVDLGLPPTPHRPDEGFHLIADLLAHSAAMKIFVLSGQNDAANARHARALGAWEFIAKPADAATLKRALDRALQAPKSAPAVAAEASGLIGDSPALGRLRNQLAQFANSPYPVLVEGESGSGKELVAASLHRMSSRASKPFFALNCAAIAPTLVEATLFGYAKGAFTGAASAKAGYFEDAQDGTLFLDEIGELPLDMQAKLLRVLENGEFQRLGETQRRVSRARIVAATNRDLRHAVKSARFRADLYHRLSVLSLAVPPLRELERDKLLLLDHFRRLYATQAGVQPFSLDPDAEGRWLRYPFPGNVRELRNHLEQCVVFGERRLPNTPSTPHPATAVDASLPYEVARRQAIDAFEREYVTRLLETSEGNVAAAARGAGLNRAYLHRLLRRHGLR